MSANERSLDDHPATTARRRPLRLLAHLAVLSIAGLASATLLPSTSGASPTVQEGRYLEGISVSVNYSCVGADQATSDILTSFGLQPFPMAVQVTSAAVEPSPSPGEDFDVPFTWDFTLDQGIVDFSIGLGVTGFTISNGVLPISATSGATGSVSGNGANATVVLGDGTIPVGYTQGPFTGTFNRTAAVDEPITFTPGTITSTVTTNSGVALQISCSQTAGALTVNDQDGVAPSTTTTTRPVVTTAAPTTTTTPVLGDSLPRTGSTTSTMVLVFVALGLIDLGYLAMTAGQPLRRRRASAS